MGILQNRRKRLTSFQIIIVGFLLVILTGSILLMLPVSARSGKGTTFADALFTATSATCVTGLVVHDTATYWSLFGQAGILLLIQIGGMTGGDIMENMVWLVVLLLVAGTSYIAVRKLDAFWETNEEEDKSDLEKTRQGTGSAYDEVEIVSDLSDASGEYENSCWNPADVLKCILMIALASAVGFGFWKLGFSESNIIMMYILCVLIISVITTHQIYSLISSVVCVCVFNFFFTEPRYTLLAYDKDYPVTFITMFVAAFLTGSLAIRLKRQAKQISETALVAQKEQMRANLLRSISHDLRTPLTSISGNASNLLTNGERFDSETKKQLYLDIYDDSMWLNNLVENVLSMTKIEDGRVDIRLQAELLDEVIAEALQHVSRRKTEHKISFQASEDFMLVKVDARLIMQAVINIVDNAIKYTPVGSEIIITTCRQQGKAVVRIADNGPGISDEMKPHVFEMFYSGAKNMADSRRSLGLGLSLCKSIVGAHGGELTLSDNTPHGAVFTFTLPIEEVDLHE